MNSSRQDEYTLPRLLTTSKPGLKPGLRAFLYHKPGPSPVQARVLGRAGPGSNGPGFGRLWALGPAQHITIWDHTIKLLPDALATLPGRLLPLTQIEQAEMSKFVQE